MDHNSSSSGGEHPNAGVVAGLRECADWLEQHPELERARYVQISFGYEIRHDARERLQLLANALGERAEEKDGWGSKTIDIVARFSGDVEIRASALKAALLPEPIALPEPEPIIPARSEAA